MPLKTLVDDAPTLNLTPMIDVVFLLIIFFMVGTKFTELERKITLQVPQVSSAVPLSAAPTKRVVNVDREGHISFDREEVTLDQLKKRLTLARSEFTELGVLVRGDADSAFQNVASVLSACRDAGIDEMGISVRLARRNDVK